jgi:hypothetical protein
MPGSATLADLHHAIQAAMGWYNSHLHQFDIAGQPYGDRRMMDYVTDEYRMTLNKLANSGAKNFGYTYDFGDNWEHVVTIEKVSKIGSEPSGPMCIAGKRACPPEDCGGLWGYYHLLEVLADPNHPEYDDQREWIAEDFDPDVFDLARTNLNIKARIT